MYFLPFLDVQPMQSNAERVDRKQVTYPAIFSGESEDPDRNPS